MSRAPFEDNSTSVSLFPFLAVLLCTMGALLVVLVAMTRSARDSAKRKAEALPITPVAQTDPAALDELKNVQQYLGELERVRNEAAKKLRGDQQRLSHLEEHMRRLQDELKKLQAAAMELHALEEEHYDDRQQAEREVARLSQLIADTREAIDALKAEQKSKRHAYALVPYEGAHGTTRRPIYVECRDDAIVLQPEGVRIERDDLRPPLGTGNPLAAALRAARDYVVRLHPEEGRNRDTEPYPLIVVRPSGASIYGVVQRAIQNSDFDFGYELVEEEWELKYPAPDPQLAIVEQQAIDHARIRLRALAAAAPRAYRHPALAASRRFEFGGDGGQFGSGGLGTGDEGEGSDDGLPGMAGPASVPAGAVGAGSAGLSGGPGSEVEAEASGQAATSEATIAPYGAAATEAANGSSSAAGQTEAAGANGPSNGQVGASSNNSSQAAAGQSATPGSNSAGAAGASSSGQTMSNSNAADPNSQSGHRNVELALTRGQDWALRGKNARAVPIRRTIRVLVRGDHLAILSEEVTRERPTPVNKTIPLKEDTVESVDEFVKAVQEQVDGWGTGGDGMYWRPVLQLQIAPDGARRAQDLIRLLNNSGFELHTPATAITPDRRGDQPRGNSRATR